MTRLAVKDKFAKTEFVGKGVEMTMLARVMRLVLKENVKVRKIDPTKFVRSLLVYIYVNYIFNMFIE